jgi:hypothetical protein
MHVALLDIGLETRSCARKNVAVAGAVHHDLGHDPLAAFLAFEDDALYGAVLDHRCRRPGMEDDPHARLDQHFLRGQFQSFRVDRGRPGDDAVESGGAQPPVSGEIRVPLPPQAPVRPGDGFRGKAAENLLGKTANDLPPVPVGHPVDPDHHASGGKPAEMIVALQHHDLRAGSRGGERCGGSGRSPTHDQHVAAMIERNVARLFPEEALAVATGEDILP